MLVKGTNRASSDATTAPFEMRLASSRSVVSAALPTPSTQNDCGGPERATTLSSLRSRVGMLFCESLQTRTALLLRDST